MKKMNLKKFLVPFMAMACVSAWADKYLTVCGSSGNVETLCGIPAAEDIEALPDGKHLLLAPFGGFRGATPVPLYWMDTTSLQAAPIAIHYENSPAVRWDEKICPKPPAPIFPAHGIHLSQRGDGAWQVLAVNHERESVEMYELDSSNKRPELIWRGCVVFPAISALNDLVAIPAGGFLVSNMMELGDTAIEDLVKVNAQNGPSGYVLRWRPGVGIDKLKNSGGNFTNGVTLSPDGKSVFISETASRLVKRLDYASGEVRGQVAASADNLSWMKDGRLLVTGITDLPDNCVTRRGLCDAAFEVRAIEPETLKNEVIFSTNGKPLLGATVAVFQGDYMYVGAFMGDRMVRMRVGKDGKLLH